MTGIPWQVLCHDPAIVGWQEELGAPYYGGWPADTSHNHKALVIIFDIKALHILCTSEEVALINQAYIMA